MYVNIDRGFGVFAFHFDRDQLEKIREDLDNADAQGRIKLLAQLMLESEVVVAKVVPRGINSGPGSVMEAAHKIEMTVVESLWRDLNASKQNVRDHRWLPVA